MQSYNCILSAFTLSTAMAFGVATMAADLPKEGTFNVDFIAFGTFKATAIGKERAPVDVQCSTNPTSLSHEQNERIKDVGRSVDQIIKVATHECSTIDDQVLAELHDRVRDRPSLELAKRPEQASLGACCVELLKIEFGER